MKKTRKKGLTIKLILSVGIPVVLVFCATMYIILATVKTNVTHIIDNEVEAKSQAASYQISEFFTKYKEASNQLSLNSAIQEYLSSASATTTAESTLSYQHLRNTIANVYQSDKDNYELVWVACAANDTIIRTDMDKAQTDYVMEDRPWFADVKDAKSPVISEPYVDNVSKKTVISIMMPIYKGSDIIGVVGTDLTTQYLDKLMQSYKLGTNGFFMLSSKAGYLVYHPDTKLIGKNLSEANFPDSLLQSIKSQKMGACQYNVNGNDTYGYVAPIGDTGWTITSGVPSSEYFQTYQNLLNTVLINLLIALIILTVILILISGTIVKPIRKLEGAANRIANGDLDVVINVTSHDEVGDVAEAMRRTVIRLKDYITYIDEVSGVLNQIARGNLSFTLEQEYAGEFEKIKTALNNIKGTLVQNVQGIRVSSDQVSSSSSQVSSGAQALAQGATEQASSIEELSATITEIAQKVKANAENAEKANSSVQTTKMKIETGGQEMQEMLEAIDKISQASKEIGKIIKAIDDIAFQTNILALNAAVEAARAGEAGKGFAVVADEVRNLAGKSAEAAKDTTAMIEEAIRAVENGTKLAQETAQTLQEVLDSSEESTNLVKEIALASETQAAAIEQITQGVDQISAVVQTNSATAEESAAASGELSIQADTLKKLVMQFHIENDVRTVNVPEPESQTDFLSTDLNDSKY